MGLLTGLLTQGRAIRPRPVNPEERLPLVYLGTKKDGNGEPLEAGLVDFLKMQEAEAELLQSMEAARQQAAAASSSHVIHVPQVRPVPDYDTTNVPAVRDEPRYSALDPATASYFRYQDMWVRQSVAQVVTDYDMDEDDEQCLAKIQAKAAQRVSKATQQPCEPVTADLFESLIQKLEHLHFEALKQKSNLWQPDIKNGKVPTLPKTIETVLARSSAVKALAGEAESWVLEAVYDHWRAKRNKVKAKGPLLQHLWFEMPWKAISFADSEDPEECGDMPFMVSEGRNSRGSRGLRATDQDAWEILAGVRGELEALRTLADQVRKRERLKKLLVKGWGEQIKLVGGQGASGSRHGVSRGWAPTWQPPAVLLRPTQQIPRPPRPPLLHARWPRPARPRATLAGSLLAPTATGDAPVPKRRGRPPKPRPPPVEEDEPTGPPARGGRAQSAAPSPPPREDPREAAGKRRIKRVGWRDLESVSPPRSGSAGRSAAAAGRPANAPSRVGAGALAASPPGRTAKRAAAAAEATTATSPLKTQRGAKVLEPKDEQQDATQAVTTRPGPGRPKGRASTAAQDPPRPRRATAAATAPVEASWWHDGDDEREEEKQDEGDKEAAQGKQGRGRGRPATKKQRTGASEEEKGETEEEEEAAEQDSEEEEGGKRAAVKQRGPPGRAGKSGARAAAPAPSATADGAKARRPRGADAVIAAQVIAAQENLGGDVGGAAAGRAGRRSAPLAPLNGLRPGIQPLANGKSPAAPESPSMWQRFTHTLGFKSAASGPDHTAQQGAGTAAPAPATASRKRPRGEVAALADGAGPGLIKARTSWASGGSGTPTPVPAKTRALTSSDGTAGGGGPSGAAAAKAAPLPAAGSGPAGGSSVGITGARGKEAARQAVQRALERKGSGRPLRSSAPPVAARRGR